MFQLDRNTFRLRVPVFISENVLHPRIYWRRRNCLYALIIFMIGIFLTWTLRSNLLHIFKYASSSEYRNCMHIRHSYAAEVKTSPLYVTLTEHGRLGNLLFSYASLLGIARANGYIPYVDSDHPIRHVLQISKVCEYDSDCLLTMTDPLPAGYVPAFNHLPGANISIDGYLQSWKYFQFVEEEIRKEFRFTSSLQSIIRSKYLGYVSKYLNEGRVVISIHVRRGDKMGKGFQSIGFKPAHGAFFKNAMNYMATKYPFSVFLVVSDEMSWCKENIKSVVFEYDGKSEKRYTPENVRILENPAESVEGISKDMNNGLIKRETIPIVYTDADSPYIDLGLLTMVNHSIISVGTFGWWGAWLSNGTVVYYKNHVIPGSVLDSQTVDEDYFPPHWIAMSSSNCKSFTTFSFLLITLNLKLSVCNFSLV